MQPSRIHIPSTPWTLWILGAAALLAVVAASLPIQFSIVTVFLFAGPHNWVELRYFLSRVPTRLGPLRGYFNLAFGGMFGLTLSFVAIKQSLSLGLIDRAAPLIHAIWSSLVIVWVALLTFMRSQQKPRRDWLFSLPLFWSLLAIIWLAPSLWTLLFIYLHPFISFWILDRELRRRRHPLRPVFHRCLLCLPLLLGLLWWCLMDAPSLVAVDPLTQRITAQAGANILTSISSHLLVATHTYLEMLHYGVWLVAIPLVGSSRRGLSLDGIPLARRSIGAWAILTGLLAVAALGVLILWICFSLDYATTRDAYFVVAMLHVLGEIPFLLRTL